MKYLIRTILLPIFMIYIACITLSIWWDLVCDYLRGGFRGAFPKAFDETFNP